MGDTLCDYEVHYIDDYWQGNSRSILIVEDHQIVRDGIRNLIRAVLKGTAVEFFEASSLASARHLVEQQRQSLDLILLDIYLPDTATNDVFECLKQDWAGLPVVVVSACEDWKLVADFMKVGVLGYIPKSSNVSVMSNALLLIFSGGRYFPPQAFGLLEPSHEFVHHLTEDKALLESSHEDMGLSPRQKEALSLILRGYPNKEIARKLGVSVGTAKNYVAAVLRAYNASSRAKVLTTVFTKSTNQQEAHVSNSQAGNPPIFSSGQK